jgi:1-acyl-sn-glycerol-3-phosphate acyltransferase
MVILSPLRGIRRKDTIGFENRRITLSGKLARQLFCGFFRVVFRLLTRVTVLNMENLPKEGGYIVASNHLGIIEVPLVFCLLSFTNVTGLVAKKHQKNPLFRWLVNIVGGIWLNREEADTRAVRAATEHLKSGGVLGISPEGTRSPTGGLIFAKTGVAYLADRAAVPIIPVGVTGTWRAVPKLLLLQRPRIIVRFGQPFTLPPVSRENRSVSLQNNTDEIMARIAVLLPPEYRGVYAEHPRLLELLKSS